MRKITCIFIQTDSKVANTKELGFSILDPTNLTPDQVAQAVNQVAPRIVVINGNCDVLSIAAAIKGYLPELRVCVTGVEANIVMDKSVDFALQSDKGEALYKLLTTDTSTPSFTRTIRGIIWKDNGNIIHNAQENNLPAEPDIKAEEVIASPTILVESAPESIIQETVETPETSPEPPQSRTWF